MSELFVSHEPLGVEDDPAREWIFTFGFGHRLVPQAFPDAEGLPLANRFVRIVGTFADARQEMIRRFGRQWSNQYHSENAAGIVKYGLRELS